MDRTVLNSWTRRRIGLGGSALLAAVMGVAQRGETKAKKKHKKKKKHPKPDATGTLVRSLAAEGANCIPDAAGEIKLFKLDGVEKMEVSVNGLPANTEFDVFVIQVPDAQFGLTWYQGDLQTDKKGNGSQSFIGRFSIETFIVAPGEEPAPVIHGSGPFPDADTNVAQPGPVHTFHVGLWFNSPDDAAAAGCPDDVTPFNGDHNAGVQALKTEPVNGLGPLAQIGS